MAVIGVMTAGGRRGRMKRGRRSYAVGEIGTGLGWAGRAAVTVIVVVIGVEGGRGAGARLRARNWTGRAEQEIGAVGGRVLASATENVAP